MSENISTLIIEKFNKKRMNDYNLEKNAKIVPFEDFGYDSISINYTSKCMLFHFANYCPLAAKEFSSLKTKIEFMGNLKHIGFSHFSSGVLHLAQNGEKYYVYAGSPFHFECESEDLSFLERIMKSYGKYISSVSNEDSISNKEETNPIKIGKDPISEMHHFISDVHEKLSENDPTQTFDQIAEKILFQCLDHFSKEPTQNAIISIISQWIHNDYQNREVGETNKFIDRVNGMRD